MKIAIMQPYFFPYIGYFQLINAVDIFVLYDDVNYIKKGWINRNRLSVSGKELLFTLPLKKAGQNKMIYSLEVSDDFELWKKKFLKTLQRNYNNAERFDEIYALVHLIFRYQHRSLLSFINYSLMLLCEYMEINTKIVLSSDIQKLPGIKGEEKILYICEKLKADVYINPIGGVDLYSKEKFKQIGVELLFVNNLITTNLCSIIDVLMRTERTQLDKMLNTYELN